VGDAASRSLCLPRHAHRVGTSTLKLSKAARWTGGGQEEKLILRYGEDFFRAASATPSNQEHNPTCWAAVAAMLWFGSRRGGGPRQAQGAS